MTKYLCILIWEKKEKLADLNRWTVHSLKILNFCQICLFCVAHNNTNLYLKIFTVVDQCVVYNSDFLQNFSKQKIADSIFFWKPSFMELGLHLDFPKSVAHLYRLLWNVIISHTTELHENMLNVSTPNDYYVTSIQEQRHVRKENQ